MKKNLDMYLRYAVFCIFLSHTLVAQQSSFTLEDIFVRGTFQPQGVYNVNWMKNGQFYTSLTRTTSGKLGVVKYDIKTGKALEILFEAPNAIDSYELSPDETKLLIASETEHIYRHSFIATYYVYDLKTKQLTKLSEGDKQSNALFSPDGSKVAFTRANNLFVTDLATRSEKAITQTGKVNSLINGSTDWVYEEEFAFTRAFDWNADGTRLAYYTFDESAVPAYNMQIWGGLYPKEYRFKYPKAGEKNATITLSIYELATNKVSPVDIGTETDIYIPRICWTQHPNILSVRRMNRLQNKLEILHANATTGQTTVILTETSPNYVDLELTDDLTYLPDGKHFIHASERSGFKHLYLYNMDGKEIQQLTTGNWEVVDFLGVDSAKKLVYFTSTEVSPLERHLYSIRMDGTQKIRLTTTKGWHTIDFSPSHSYYLDVFSDANTPPSTGLYLAPSGKLVKMLEENTDLKKRLPAYHLAKKEFFQFTTPDQTTLNGFMIKPAHFDATKKYPVFMFVYGGPGNQQVSDSWGHTSYLWHQLLAQNGYLVVCVDNRGTGGRGTAFRQSTYANLGKYEVQDQIDAAKYVGSLPYVDKTRIGIHGWSYGGFMTALCMTVGADYFKVGLVGAPVTNFSYYDTIYTERYMKRPQDNPTGYAFNPITYADKLKGKMLLIHGTGDDNVHFQNSIAFQEALITKGKQFDTFIYPNQPHAVRGKSQIHLYHLMTNYILKNL